MNATKQNAGRLGGLATVEKYGKPYMAEIGRKGACVTWQRYTILPVGIGAYALVDRESGKVKSISGFQF